MSINYIVIVAIWLVALLCIKVMKRLEPENKAYPVLAIMSAIMVTTTCLLREFS